MKTERPILFKGHLVRKILAGEKSQTRRLVKNLKVIPRRRVGADYPTILDPSGKMVAEAGKRYEAYLNQHGAVSAETEGGRLGLKPGEFDFVCPYAECRTYLENHKWVLEPIGTQTLWVKETILLQDPNGLGAQGYISVYAADSEPTPCDNWVWKRDRLNSIHCPRGLSRINLQVLRIRLERLQAITEAEAKAEGVKPWNELFPTGLSESQTLTSGERALDSPYRSGFAVTWDELHGDRCDTFWKADPWIWTVEFKRLP